MVSAAVVVEGLPSQVHLAVELQVFRIEVFRLWHGGEIIASRDVGVVVPEIGAAPGAIECVLDVGTDVDALEIG